MPIGDSPWGSCFGMFRDKFGIEWMVDFQNKRIKKTDCNKPVNRSKPKIRQLVTTKNSAGQHETLKTILMDSIATKTSFDLQFTQIVHSLEKSKTFFQEMLGVTNFCPTDTTRLQEL